MLFEMLHCVSVAGNGKGTFILCNMYNKLQKKLLVKSNINFFSICSFLDLGFFAIFPCDLITLLF